MGDVALVSLHFHAIGLATPRHFIAQEDAAGLAQTLCISSEAQQLTLTKLYRRAGVRARRSVVLTGSTNGVPAQQAFYPPAIREDDLGPSTAERMRVYEQSAAALANSAASEALAKAETAPREVTHLITVSCTGFHSPGVDVALVRDLGLNAGVSRTNVGFMGCHAALNGLRVAKAFTDSDPDVCVLLCAVELCSLHYQYGWRPDRVVSNSLFADGAAAVVSRGRSLSAQNWRLISSASTIIPETEDVMRWQIGDHGFEMTLAAKLPGLIRGSLRPWLESWLTDLGMSIGDIARWAIHPGGSRVLAAAGDACGLTEADLHASVEVLAEYGNMSSPTVLFVLERLQRQSISGPCVALAFGPGLTIEAALLNKS